MIFYWDRTDWKALAKPVDAKAIRAALQVKFPKSCVGPLKDARYCSIPWKDGLGEMQDYIMSSQRRGKTPAYSADDWDCDDQAEDRIAAIRRWWGQKMLGLGALAVGVVDVLSLAGNLHELCWLYEAGGQIIAFEGGTGKECK